VVEVRDLPTLEHLSGVQPPDHTGAEGIAMYRGTRKLKALSQDESPVRVTKVTEQEINSLRACAL